MNILREMKLWNGENYGQEQFNSLLFEYYNTGENRELKQFLYDNAILGLTI